MLEDDSISRAFVQDQRRRSQPSCCCGAEQHFKKKYNKDYDLYVTSKIKWQDIFTTTGKLSMTTAGNFLLIFGTETLVVGQSAPPVFPLVTPLCKRPFLYKCNCCLLILKLINILYKNLLFPILTETESNLYIQFLYTCTLLYRYEYTHYYFNHLRILTSISIKMQTPTDTIFSTIQCDPGMRTRL